ncbi:transposase [Rhabdochromatium marinum]|uniref:transposase n=1 Tax=Rhabdochromatium marinum TaxID=48729 RepID=UPI00190735AF|nr:transposase [Rhabdochromatium marinum]
MSPSSKRLTQASRTLYRPSCLIGRAVQTGKKAKAKIQRIHTKSVNARRDSLHKTTTTISKNHAMLCIKDLQVRTLSASAAGTLDAPGTHVQAKSMLNSVRVRGVRVRGERCVVGEDVNGMLNIDASKKSQARREFESGRFGCLAIPLIERSITRPPE